MRVRVRVGSNPDPDPKPTLNNQGWGRQRADEGELELRRYEERHAWPGATQLTLKFDPRCCTEEGDWLTVSFYKGQVAVPAETRRYCGGGEGWPKAPLTRTLTLNITLT